MRASTFERCFELLGVLKMSCQACLESWLHLDEADMRANTTGVQKERN